MKKSIYTFVALLTVSSLVFLACKKKQDETIKPTYKEEATGTASNPNPNNITVTGQTNTTTVATENSYIAVGTAGWSNLSCITTNSLYLKSTYGSCEVTLNFQTPPAAGTQTYQIASQPGLLACSMVITGEPDQPAGTVWYGYEGQVSVVTVTQTPPLPSYVNASIIGSVKCHQSTFNFPIVTVTGQLGCN